MKMFQDVITTLYDYKGIFPFIKDDMEYHPNPSNIKNHIDFIDFGECVVIKIIENDRYGLGIRDYSEQIYDHSKQHYVLKFENIATYPLITACFVKDDIIVTSIDVVYNNCIIMMWDDTNVENLMYENLKNRKDNSLASKITYKNCLVVKI